MTSTPPPTVDQSPAVVDCYIADVREFPLEVVDKLLKKVYQGSPYFFQSYDQRYPWGIDSVSEEIDTYRKRSGEEKEKKEKKDKDKDKKEKKDKDKKEKKDKDKKDKDKEKDKEKKKEKEKEKEEKKKLKKEEAKRKKGKYTPPLFVVILNGNKEIVGFARVDPQTEEYLRHTANITIGFLPEVKSDDIGKKALGLIWQELIYRKSMITMKVVTEIKGVIPTAFIEIVYSAVREDNVIALELFKSSGFEKLTTLEKEIRTPDGNYFNTVLFRKIVAIF